MRKVNPNRVRTIKQGAYSDGAVIYWMSRDQRSYDNWALIYAQEKALDARVPLIVAFCLVPTFLDATIRQYRFMIDGLKEVETDLKKKHIPFFLLTGDPKLKIPRFIKTVQAGLLITDFDPLRIKMEWVTKVAKRIRIPFHQVDARNIVPCWIASPKQEWSAATLRPKISRLLDEHIEAFPKLRSHPYMWTKRMQSTSWANIENNLKVDRKVKSVAWIKPGQRAAQKQLSLFIKNGLAAYDSNRNDPTKHGQSDLSPYLHFGQLSSQRIVMDVLASSVPRAAKAAFIEELVVRRELSDNFCFYNKHYDSFEGFADWAKKTLNDHRKDKRKYIYSLKDLERANTHDPYWNAAQIEMAQTGKMHGYMRMYWAKKILEWSKSPEIAIAHAIYLNDKYELDGRDSNGYAGVMWSIGGIHDRAWNERPIFGKIRYMNDRGLSRKFNMDEYINRYLASE